MLTGHSLLLSVWGQGGGLRRTSEAQALLRAELMRQQLSWKESTGARLQQGFVRGMGGCPGLACSARTPHCFLLLRLLWFLYV